MSSTAMSPDLASVLRTLASFTSAQPPASHPPPNPPPPTHTLEEGEEEEDEEEYDPSNFVPTTTIIPPAPAAPTPQRPVSTPPSQSNPVAAPPSSVSSSTITTWPPALRHVMKSLIPNQAATHRIRHLIKTQHEHERQWWAGREALVLKQQGREEGRRRLNDVLLFFATGKDVEMRKSFKPIPRILIKIYDRASVGGLVNPLNDDCSPTTDLEELSQYDLKVHRACTAMVAATTTELARLGVPFFNTRPELLLPSTNEDADERRKSDGLLDESQLRELQARMLVLLEDLCSE